MKTSWIAMLLGLAAMSLTVASAAAPVHSPSAAKPTSVIVTVAVTGFSTQLCPALLQQDLARIPGVVGVIAKMDPARVAAKLDESKLTVSQFVNAISTHPQAVDPKRTYGAMLMLYVDTAMCAHAQKMCPACFTEIPKQLKAVKGVRDVQLDSTGKIVSITFVKGAHVKTNDLIHALKKSALGFSVSTTPTTPHA